MKCFCKACTNKSIRELRELLSVLQQKFWWEHIDMLVVKCCKACTDKSIRGLIRV